MFGWFRRIGERISEAISDALESLRERLFGRDEEELRDEADEEVEEEELEELEEVGEEGEDVAEVAGEYGDEYIIEQIEAIEEEQQAAQQATLDAQVQAEVEGAEDDTHTIYELFEETAESLAQNEHLLTNDELERAETLLEDAAALMDELREMSDEDDRAAAIDLILEALAEVERIVERAIERVDHGEGGCEDARGPFVSYADAVAYARSIPCPTWLYSDGMGWWWVCMDDCSPKRVEA